MCVFVADQGSSTSMHVCLPCRDSDAWMQLLFAIAKEIELDGSLALLHARFWIIYSTSVLSTKYAAAVPITAMHAA